VRNFAAIFEKELRSYFASPVAYVMAGVWLLFSGFMFKNLLLEFNRYCLTYNQQQMGRMPSLNLNDFVVTNYFGMKFFVWMIVLPFLTMRLYSEEKKTGTIELLVTSPLTTMQALMGKFAACLTLYAAVEALGFSHLLIVRYYGSLDWGPVLSAYLASLLMGGAFVALGLLASAVTENQIIAGVVAFFMFIMLWLIDWSSRFTGPAMGAVLNHLSVLEHLRDFQRGVIDTGDAVFFLGLTALGLFLTHTVLESRRWRQ
jgi:ABC-2 type transport system permease protein